MSLDGLRCGVHCNTVLLLEYHFYRSLCCAGGLLVQSGRLDSNTEEEDWSLQLDTKDVAAALDVRGICEGPLKKSIAAAFPTTGIPRQLFFCIMYGVPSLHVLGRVSATYCNTTFVLTERCNHS